MRKVILMAVVLIMAGCGFMKNSTTSNPSSNQPATASPTTTTTTENSTSNAALVAGQGAGNALQAIYAQYKVDGNKYDYKNLQNIMNTVTLVANCEGLKENYKDKTYLAEFGKGMVASSLGLVTQNNVQTVTNSLVEMVKNSETVQNAQTKTTQAVQSAATQAQNTANQAASYANTAAQYAGALSSLLGAFGNK